MYRESLPGWVWVIYYTFLLVTFGLAVLGIKQNRLRKMSVLTVVITFMMPIIGFINSIGREEGINEWEHFVMHLQQGALWAVYTLLAAVYLIVWWGLFFFKKGKV